MTRENSGAEFGDGIQEGAGDGLDAQVDGCEESVFHQDDVTAMGVGDDDMSFGIEEGDIAVDDEPSPA